MKEIWLMLGCLGVFSGAHGTEVSSVENFKELWRDITNRLQDPVVLNDAVLNKMKNLSPALQDFMSTLSMNETKEESMVDDLSKEDVFFTVQGIIRDLNSHLSEQELGDVINHIISVINYSHSCPEVKGVLGMLLAFYPAYCSQSMAPEGKKSLGIEDLNEEDLYERGIAYLQESRDENIDYEIVLARLESEQHEEKNYE